MTTKRKKKKSFVGGRAFTVSLSLCLLAVVAMAGMYAVGKTEQEQEELERQIAEAEELERAQQKAREAEIARQEELEREQEAAAAASAAAQRQKEEALEPIAEQELDLTNVAELESDFAVQEPEMAEAVVVEEVTEETAAEEIALSFSPDKDILLWPIAGNIILDYSMDKSVYFSTLDQYKYNPAVIIQGTVDESVLCGAQGKVASIEKLEETGTTVTVDIGSGYELIYGQLKELTVAEGDYVNEGQTLGYVSEPTYYYAKEGSNVYFEVRKDGESIDPMSLLQ